MAIFASKNKKSQGYSYFAGGATLEGRLCFSGMICLDGRVNGEVISSGSLVIEETAIITGKVMAENITVSGTVYGSLQAAKQLHLNPQSKVYGHIWYSELNIDGALHEGSSHKLDAEEAQELAQNCQRLVEEAAANVEKAAQKMRAAADKSIAAARLARVGKAFASESKAPLNGSKAPENDSRLSVQAAAAELPRTMEAEAKGQPDSEPEPKKAAL